MILPIGNQKPLVTNKEIITYKSQHLSLEHPSSCDHERFDENGYCKDCGYECVLHNFENGQCMTCGYECEHYDKDDHCCLDCGMERHEFDTSYDFWD